MRRTVLATLFLSVILLVAGCGQGDEGAQESRAVAIVNGEQITEKELNAYLDQYKEVYASFGIDFDSEEGQEVLESLKTEVLNGLIEKEVVLQAAQNEGYEADPAEVEERLKEVKEQFESEEKLAEMLSSLHMTEADLKEEIAQSLVYEQFVRDKIGQVEVTEEELEKAYQEHEEQTGEKVDEETKQLINEQLVLLKEQEQIVKLLEELKEKSEIEILM